MRRMNEEELNDDQFRFLDELEGAARELLWLISDDEYDGGDLEDIYNLIEDAVAIIEKRGLRAHFPTHIDDGENSYTIDYTDEEIK